MISVICLALATLSAPSASAAQLYTLHLVKTGNKKNQVNKSSVLASCSVGRSGTTCTITKGKTATRTVETGLGFSRKRISASLGISASKSVSINVSCTSPKLKKGQVFRAYPVGTRHYYTLYRYNNKTGSKKVEKKSAFNPYSNQIHCE